KGKPCDMFGSDLRIHVPENTLYTYPDFSIICGKPETNDEEKDTIIKPSAIIEVLSKSTKDYDRGSKFMLYRSINTLNEYITIDSLSISIEIYTRNSDNTWILSEFKQLHDSFVLSTIGLTLLLKDVYEDVKIED
ncbi:MAG: Uma2 family endonuclease, partial [Bacteroidota bacterium]|nr:Uma2 family endonuclease [Bacteroidota bacterium]